MSLLLTVCVNSFVHVYIEQNSPLNHEGPAGQLLPAKAQHLASLPLEISLVPLQMH